MFYRFPRLRVFLPTLVVWLLVTELSFLRAGTTGKQSHGNYGAEFIVTGKFQNAENDKNIQVRVFVDTPEEMDAGVSRSLRNTFEPVSD
jgi:hypothetical protein